MVKVPIGKIVKVDLWDSKKKCGMIKYNTNTMELVRAESEFDLKKGDTGIVIESHDSFVLIVPKDEYTDCIKGLNLKGIDLKKLGIIIYKILKDREKETGGILSFEEIYSILKRTSIQDIITKKHLNKTIKAKEVYFDRIKEAGKTYLSLKPSDCHNDQREIIRIANNYSYITVDIIQKSTNWTNLRINRILNYLVELKRFRKESSYLTGDRYFSQNN